MPAGRSTSDDNLIATGTQTKKKRLIEEVEPPAAAEPKAEPESEAVDAQPETKPKKKRKKAAAADDVAEAAAQALLQELDSTPAAGATAFCKPAQAHQALHSWVRVIEKV